MCPIQFHASTIELGHGEDASSIADHMNIMTKEMRKPLPDMTKVSVSMARTFANRKAWLYLEHPLVADIIDKYPAFKDEEQVLPAKSIHKQLHDMFNVLLVTDICIIS